MTLRRRLLRFVEQEDVNFLLTNRIPRYALTVFMGWFSKIEQPLVRETSMALWRMFADLELHEAKTQKFRSLHDCFVRELKDDARPIDPRPEILTSPCDAIVGACGRIEGCEVLQVKNSPYDLGELLHDRDLVEVHKDGCYVTLRLLSSMYHRFHAPHDCRIDRVTYISGDVWNVNPIALRRIEKLFCKNERAVIYCRLSLTDHPITLVPVAAILVASMRFDFIDTTLGVSHKGPKLFPCDIKLNKGQQMGWFEHGSTIIMFAPKGCSLYPGVEPGFRIRVGEPLMRLDS